MHASLYFRLHKVPYLFYILGLFLLQGCANIVPPEGGKKDETPPVLLAINPGDSALNASISKIELRFNKYMEVHDLEKHMQISPFLDINPTVIAYGKRVEIKITDTLRPNTTYRLTLGNALVDNREATPFKNFVYVFSTGAYFDSLQLKGRVFDAATGMPDTAAVLMLYPAGDNDSAVVRHKPLYAVKVNAAGNFSFQFLPEKPFRIYALQDANSNYLYDMGQEKIGFLGETVVPSMQPDTLVFPVFKEWVDTAALTVNDTAKKAIASDTAKKGPLSFKDRSSSVSARNAAVRNAKNNIGYRVVADTSNPRTRTFELTQPLTIEVYKELAHLDTGKVYLSYDNGGIEVEAVQQLKTEQGDIKIHTQWQSDKLYTLRLVKGWAKDTSGAELPPGKYFFRTKQTEDYGTIRIHIGREYLNDSLVLYVYKAADSIYQKPIKDSVVTLSLLQPGEYGMRLIVDANKNGKWDEGSLFKKIQPEKVIPYSGAITLKAGWESDIDFVAPAPPKKQETPAEQPPASETPPVPPVDTTQQQAQPKATPAQPAKPKKTNKK